MLYQQSLCIQPCNAHLHTVLAPVRILIQAKVFQIATTKVLLQLIELRLKRLQATETLQKPHMHHRQDGVGITKGDQSHAAFKEDGDQHL